MNTDKFRGTGRTKRQMEKAANGSVFVWVNGMLHYPRRLAIAIGRDDLLIVSPSWLRTDNIMGQKRDIVIDHACRPDYKSVQILRSYEQRSGAKVQEYSSI